jgi:DNA (cytosine-5)-methyltransferase 1
MRARAKTAVDLFCGCGGISAGLAMAGYEILAGIDIEKHYISTFKHNFPDAVALTEDIAAIKPAQFARRTGIRPGELRVLAGGPPCQGFSKNVPRKYRYLGDPKNLLVKSFLDYAEYLQPHTILMENVAEMKNGFDGQYTDEILTRLDRSGYTVTHGVLNAADYGVPQRRRRAFFMANRKGVEFAVPKPTHRPAGAIVSLAGMPPHINVWDAISDLPSLAHGEGAEVTRYRTRALSDFQTLVRNADGVTRNHVARFLQPLQYKRLAALAPGEGHKDLPARLQVKGGYSGAYGRLTKDMVAPTITRWVFHPGSGRFGHPVDIRLLSIREVARIQGFPDSYEFVGTYTQQAGQLGNAVPPILAQCIIASLDEQLRQSASSSSSKRSRDSFWSEDGKRKLIA